MTDENKIWISNGNMGCTFASIFAKNPQRVNWVTLSNPEFFYIPDDCALLSIQFPGRDIEFVKKWALNNGFYLEDIEWGLKGLRYNVGDKIAWVQYFGLDSHVKTRQAPIPELMLCLKLPPLFYAKVGFNGVLHLAHASIEGMKEIKLHKLWDTSYKKTRKLLGYSPTLAEAAKTTFQ